MVFQNTSANKNKKLFQQCRWKILTFFKSWSLLKKHRFNGVLISYIKKKTSLRPICHFHHGCPLLLVLFWPSWSSNPVLVILSWMSFTGCPFPGGPVLAVLSWLSSLASYVLAVLSEPSCPGCPLWAVLSWPSFPGCPPLTGFSCLCCPGFCSSAWTFWAKVFKPLTIFAQGILSQTNKIFFNFVQLDNFQ
jgi:hypothetical protein